MEREAGVVVVPPSTLSSHVPEWDDLAANAVEKNVFYESWMLLPALQYFADRGVTILEIWLGGAESAEPRLVGLLPLSLGQRYRRTPIRHYQMWQYLHCYLCTPLLRKGFERQALQAFLQWLNKQDEGQWLFHLNYFRGDGRFCQLLTGLLKETGRKIDVTERHSRPKLDFSIGVDHYLEKVLSGNQRRKLRAKERHLGELGCVEKTNLERAGDIECWLEEFLDLEASGWKRRSGTALALTGTNRSFFKRICRGAFDRKQLLLRKLSLDSRPIAMTCNFVSGDSLFIFKIAYDESLAKYSPGVLLGLDKTTTFLSAGRAGEIDSCSAPGPSVWSQLWNDERVICSYAISGTSIQSKALVSLGAGLKAARGMYQDGVEWWNGFYRALKGASKSYLSFDHHRATEDHRVLHGKMTR